MLKIHPANLSQSAFAARRGELAPPSEQSAVGTKPKVPDLPESHVPVGSLGVPVIVAADPSEKLKVLVSAEEVIRNREQARNIRRAERAKRRFAAAVALSAVAAAFLCGFGYVKLSALASRLGTAEVVETRPSAQAMDLLDRGMRAKNEERYDEAADLAAQARAADPGIRGADVLVAMAAMKQQRPDVVEAASREALKRGIDVPSAKLLLALNAWMLRAQFGQGIAPAESALRQTAEVCADAPFEADAYFFLGEMNRTLGLFTVSHANFLSALRRMGPWSSASILEAKIQSAPADLDDDQGRQIVAGNNELPDDPRLALTAWQLRQLEADTLGAGGIRAKGTLLEAHRTSPIQIRQTEQPSALNSAPNPEAP